VIGVGSLMFTSVSATVLRGAKVVIIRLTCPVGDPNTLASGSDRDLAPVRHYSPGPVCLRRQVSRPVSTLPAIIPLSRSKLFAAASCVAISFRDLRGSLETTAAEQPNRAAPLVPGCSTLSLRELRGSGSLRWGAPSRGPFRTLSLRELQGGIGTRAPGAMTSRLQRLVPDRSSLKVRR
jgi:hypothetical protein